MANDRFEAHNSSVAMMVTACGMPWPPYSGRQESAVQPPSRIRR